MNAVFLSPHADDETLFGAFTLLRERPLVVVVYDCGPEREAETNAAMEILGCRVEHWRLPVDAGCAAITERLKGFYRIFAPMWEPDGQPEHNDVSNAAGNVRAFADVVWYATYTPEGKRITASPVPYEPEWVALKVAALGCYPSQSGHPSHAPHFVRDQTEYLSA